MEVKNIKLISNALCYGPAPNPDEEVEQRLTINRSGRVWFSATDFQNYLSNEKVTRRCQIGMNRWHAQYLLDLVDHLDQPEMVTDCGSFILKIRYEDEHTKEIFGTLVGDATATINGMQIPLAKLIRRIVPIEGLFGFDSDMEEDYAGYEEIVAFTEAWEPRFLSGNLKKQEFEDAFGLDCADLGFRMDAFDELEERFPGCMDVQEAGENSYFWKTDVDHLGSAVFSQWRRLTDSKGNDDLDAAAGRWFARLLNRMNTMAKDRAGEAPCGRV